MKQFIFLAVAIFCLSFSSSAQVLPDMPWEPKKTRQQKRKELRAKKRYRHN
jgi:hypothetical protein